MPWANSDASRVHARVYRNRGRASQHKCVGCGKSALDWSHIHDTDPEDPANYEPRCRKCHRAYDYDILFSEENRKKISDGQKESWKSTTRGSGAIPR